MKKKINFSGSVWNAVNSHDSQPVLTVYVVDGVAYGFSATSENDERRRSEKNQEGPDSWLSWTVAMACFLFTFSTIGLSKSNSVVYFEYMQVTGLSREWASWPFSIAGFSIIFTAPLIGIGGRFMSPRSIGLIGALAYFGGSITPYFTLDLNYMIVFFGLVRGVGVAVVVSLIPAFINQYFDRYRATAQGIVGSGNSLGVIVSSFAVTYGLETYTLGGTLLILAGISLNAVAACLLLKPAPWLPSKHGKTVAKPREAHDNPTFVADETAENGLSVITTKSALPPSPGTNDSSSNKKKVIAPKTTDSKQMNVGWELLSILINYKFLLVTLTFTVIINANLIFNTIVIDYADGVGIPKEEGIYILLAYSVGEMLAKLCLGWITERHYLSQQGYFVVAISIFGALYIAVPSIANMSSLSSDNNTIILSAVFFVCGSLQGSVMSYTTLFFLQYFGRERVQLAFSLFLMVSGSIALTRPSIIGYFRDGMGSYDNLFRALGGSLIFAASVWLVERTWTHLNCYKQERPTHLTNITSAIL